MLFPAVLLPSSSLSSSLACSSVEYIKIFKGTVTLKVFLLNYFFYISRETWCKNSFYNYLLKALTVCECVCVCVVQMFSNEGKTHASLQSCHTCKPNLFWVFISLEHHRKLRTYYYSHNSSEPSLLTNCQSWFPSINWKNEMKVSKIIAVDSFNRFG